MDSIAVVADSDSRAEVARFSRARNDFRDSLEDHLPRFGRTLHFHSRFRLDSALDQRIFDRRELNGIGDVRDCDWTLDA